MLDDPEVRGHLVRKRMLCFAVDCEANGFPVQFRNMNISQLQLLSPDTAECLNDVPLLIPPFHLGLQLRTAVEDISMWAGM